MSSGVIRDISKKLDQSPQYEHLWRVELPSLSRSGMDQLGVVDGNSVGEEAMSIVQGTDSTLVDTENLNHRITSIDVPFRAFETKKNTIKSSYFFTAGNNEVGSVSLRVDELEDGLTLKYFNAWQSLIMNANGTYNLPFVYKRRIILVKISACGSDLHMSTYNGYFPTEISPASYSYESGGVSQYSISFTGDSVDHVVIPVATVRQKVQAAQRGITAQHNYPTSSMSSDLLGSVVGLINKGINLF